MARYSRCFVIVAILLTCITACGLPGSSGKNASSENTGNTVSAAPAGSSSAPPPITTCPADLSKFSGCYTPYRFQLAYGLRSLLDKGYTGKGQTIIDIVSFGSPTLQKDMDVFSQQFGLPQTTIQVISPLNVKEYDPRGDKPGWASETTLDVQIIHAIAPDAKIVVLQSPVAETEGTIGLPEFRQLEQYVIDHKLGNIISQSWGASELTLQDSASQRELKLWNDLFQNGTTRHGITYFSSSGDAGATDYADLDGKQLAQVQTTSFAPDSPWVTSVGGTTLLQKNGTFTERGWSGSGGGFSKFYQTPDYQKSLPASTQQQFNNRRGVPDVSAAADPYTGLAFYQAGAWSVAGGTSASAPLWSGIAAIANQVAGHPLGFINPALYKLAASGTYAQDFRDVTVGDNSNPAARVKGFPAAQGWDPITGLGSPNAEKLIPDLIKAA